MLKGNVRVVTPEDMGLTEDEYINFLIEMMEVVKNYKPDYSKPQYIVPNPPVTITIHNPKYLDLGDENN